MHGNGSYLILDTGNDRVRSVDTNGIMSTLFKVPGGITTGRGLWAKKDNSLVYFCSGTSVNKWTPTDGVTLLNNKFLDLGNLDVDPTGHVFVNDRGDNKVCRLGNNGGRTAVAGNGAKTGGGDGLPRPMVYRKTRRLKGSPLREGSKVQTIVCFTTTCGTKFSSA